MRAVLLAFFVVMLAFVAVHAQATATNAASNLTTLVELLARHGNDAQFQLDILKGMSDGLRGRRNVPMPPGWEPLAARLRASANPEVRELTQSLSVMFGSLGALDSLRAALLDRTANFPARSNALQALLQVKEPSLPAALRQLLGDPTMRRGALRGLAAFDDPETAKAILEIYEDLDIPAKSDALTTLSARASFAKAMLGAIERKNIPAGDITADVLRQLRGIRDDEIAERVTRIWGVVRESAADKLQEMERFRALVKAKGYGDPQRGRAVFAKICQQCHVLFEEGGKLGPELTGSNRGELDYVLQHVIDPNAVIPSDYRTWNVETKDDRSITGIVTKQDANAVTVMTANETLVIPRNELASLNQTELSIMPEGLLQAMSEDDVRDLVAYLRSPAQVPLPPEQK